MAQVVLRRIQRMLRDIGRLLETEDFSHSMNLIHQCLVNVDRIRNYISNEKYRALQSSLHELEIVCTPHLHNESSVSYSAERVPEGRGRPQVSISRDQLQILVQEGYTASQIGILLKCSKSVVYKKCYQYGIKFKEKYSNLNDEELLQHIRQLHARFPNSGSEMMVAMLRSQGIHIQRQRVRNMLNSIDVLGTAFRWGNTVQRRTYKVPTPNSLWHMDANLKLSRWGFVTHGCIDGYSRMITYIKCATSITACTVLRFFVPSVKRFGLPSRVRSDHGYENIFVAILMNCIRGIGRGSHIAGKSTHNQRIERLWRDVRTQVLQSFYKEFYDLEASSQLDPEDNIHLYALQFIYLDVINETLSLFQNAWNHHRIRTANRKTPRQLWLEGMLLNINSTHTAVLEVFSNEFRTLRERTQRYFSNEDIAVRMEDEVSPFTATLDLTDEQKQNLQLIKDGTQNPKEKYLAVIAYLSTV